MHFFIKIPEQKGKITNTLTPYIKTFKNANICPTTAIGVCELRFQTYLSTRKWFQKWPRIFFTLITVAIPTV